MILSILAALVLFVLILPYLRDLILIAFIIAAVAGLLTIGPFIYQAVLEQPESVAILLGMFLFAAGVLYVTNQPVRPRGPAAQTFAFKLGRRLGQLLVKQRVRGSRQHT
jgi:hypothetical protein